MSRLDLNLLPIFKALMAERSVTKAAGVLNLSQPAVSHALNRLRESLDDPLLVKTAEGMVPTRRALELEAPVNDILARAAWAFRPPAAFDPTTAEQHFTIVAPEYFEMTLLPELVALLEREAPGISLTIQPMVGDFPLSDLETGKVDLAVTFEGYLPQSKILLTHRLVHDRLACVVSEGQDRFDHPLTVDDIVENRHIYVAPWRTSTNMVDQWMKRQGLKRPIAATVHNYTAAVDMVCRTGYLLTLPDRITRQLSQLYPLKRLEPPPGYPDFWASLVWHPLTDKDPAQLWLRAQILRVAEAL